MVIDTVAGKEEVLQRAIENLKNNKGIDMTFEEMDELYEIVSDYIEDHLEKEPTCTVKLPNLGEAYYMQVECNRRKRNTNSEEKKKLWQERSDKIEEFYQNNQTKKNRKKGFKIYHVIKAMWKKNKTYGYNMQDIESLQNGLE